MKLFATLFAICAIAFATLLVTSTSSASTVTGGIGFVQGATNFGAQYDKAREAFDVGGYFFYQTSKDKNSSPLVYQVTSFGGQLKVHAVQNSRMDLYIAPGFGMHMIKDAPDGTNAVTGAAKKTDVTAFGPTMRIGALLPLTSTIKVGLERLEIVNWFDDRPVSDQVHYMAAVAVGF